MAWLPIKSSEHGVYSNSEKLACENAIRINPEFARIPQTIDEYYGLTAEHQHVCDVLFGDKIETMLAEKAAARAPKKHYEREENETDQDAAARELTNVVEKFRKLHPQYRPSRENLRAISARRQEMNIAITDYSYEVLCGLFIAAALAGELELDPRAIGLDSDSLSGPELIRAIRERKDFEKLLDEYEPPAPGDVERERIQRMSATEFEEQDTALRWARDQEKRAAKIRDFELEVKAFLKTAPDFIPGEEHRDMILQWLEEKQLPMSTSNIRAAFFALTGSGQMERDESRLARWNGSTLQISDVEESHVGSTDPVGALDGSLKRRIRSMSADEYSLFLQNNPDMARKIDEAGA